ncbi:unnamed protein product [Schistosoma spindalis]|nr:unnamed protein product [Schistosoma spindale]
MLIDKNKQHCLRAVLESNLINSEEIKKQSICFVQNRRGSENHSDNMQILIKRKNFSEKLEQLEVWNRSHYLTNVMYKINGNLTKK